MKPINNSQWFILSQVLGESVTQLFDCYKVPIDSAQYEGDREARPGELAAFIGFTGQQLKGSVLITTSRALILSSNPQSQAGGTLPDEDLRDWAGELSNQLVGRLKNKLFDYGVTIDLSTPTTLAGDMLRAGPSGPMSGRLSTFTSGEHIIEVFFNARMPDDAVLIYNPLPPDQTGTEGDLMFF